MARPHHAEPTLPIPADAVGRRELLAALSFVEQAGTGTFTVAGLREWFERHIVTPGVMPRPVMVNEPSAGSIPLHPSGMLMALAEQNIQRVLFTARSRVVDALRGLLASPVDDRFLTAAIFAGRVKRRRVIDSSHWVARPEPTAPLSGIVLSLFAVDILTHREGYDRDLCICEVCGRVSFQKMPATRRSCREHPLHESGYTHRAVTPRRPLG